MKNIEDRVNKGILGIKPYVPGKTVYEVARERGVNNIIKLASNENPFGMAGKAKDRLSRDAAAGFAYPEVTTEKFRTRLAEKLGIAANAIITGNGGDGIIYALAMTLLNEGDEAIIPEITFPYYEIAVRMMRGNVVSSAMKEYAIDLEDILQKITPKTKMIWLCNPNNPTGLQINKEEINRFLDRVPEQVFVIHDEVYADFADLQAFPDTLEMIRSRRENLFLIRSCSKIYGLAGVRLGYGIGDPDLVSMMYRVRPPFDVSVLAELAGVAALEDDEFYNKTLELTRSEKEYYYQECATRKLFYLPSATNFILIDVKSDCMAIADAMLDSGVIVRPCANYGLPSFIRVTIGIHEQNVRFFTALDRALKQQ
ncbi:MAG: histidinol-phosphate transaminase [Spirochaetales bacterium]|nr:histidinol-phosphate transaminase [Spirochaetales bacterium]